MRRKTLLILGISVLIAAGGIGLAVAQTPMPDPLDTRSAKRLDDMEQVVRELRAIVYQGRATGQPVVIEDSGNGAKIATLTQRVDDLSQKISDLTATLTSANASRDDLGAQLQASQRALNQANAANTALANRVAALEKRNADADAAARADAQQAAAEAALTSDQLFARARQSYADGDMPNSEKDFTTFLARFPADPQAPEASYWLGEIQSARADFSDASLSFVLALKDWPKTDWAPVATLDLARSLISTGDNQQACQALTELSRRYPKAPAPVPARAASARSQAKCR